MEGRDFVEAMDCYEARGNEHMGWVFIENLQDLISWPGLSMRRTTLLSPDTRLPVSDIIEDGFSLIFGVFC
jgi:hypothetical protein